MGSSTNFLARPMLGMVALAMSLTAIPRVSNAKQIQLDVGMAYPTMLISDQNKGQNHMRIALTGFDLPSREERQPVNIAIVIDKSGSMQGDKIAQAKRAAENAVDRLRDSDIISIITYDSTVEVVVPATKASDRDRIKERIRAITAGGNTALFAGVSKGAHEVRKFLEDKRVNRVILLSDGLANVGPSTPSELAQLGESLIKEGISVSTLGLGLGFNEDLMTQLALASGGNHVFIEDAENLAHVFQAEFDDVMSVVAQKIRIRATLAEGLRPVKVLNSNADITGQTVSIDLGQLYSQQERYFVIEVEVPYGESGSQQPVADVAVEYLNMVTDTNEKLTSTVQVKFTDDQSIVQNDVCEEVLASCAIQIANVANEEATLLRDAGNISEAQSKLKLNALYLNKLYDAYRIEDLKRLGQTNEAQAEAIVGGNWNRNRKAMREIQSQSRTQQTYSGKKGKN